MNKTDTTHLEHPAAQWQTLVNIATLGTDRVGSAAPTPDAPWRSACSTKKSDPTEQTLHDIATLAIYEQAGLKPNRQEIGQTSDKASDQPCNTNETICPPAACQHLAEILGRRDPWLLIQWCNAALASDTVAPPEAVPDLLKRALSNKNDSDRDALLKLAGQRGQWLALQHKDWRKLYATGATTLGDPLKLWESGTTAQRLATLRSVRLSDPAGARELVEATWKQESANDRAEMLQALGENLTDADEPWLEACLDDRSKQVKAVAAQHLARLPSSAFAQRMTKRMSDCIQYAPGKGLIKKKKPSLEIALPSQLDDAMKRDSLDDRARDRMGKKASLLNQMLSLTPLSYWASIADAPESWIQSALASDWALPCIDGWKTAAASQHDTRWAQTLLSEVCLIKPSKKDAINITWRQDAIDPLLACLPDSEVEAITLKLLADMSLTSYNPCAETVLNGCAFAWSTKLSRAVIGWLPHRLIHKDAVYDYTLRSLITDTLPRRLSPLCLDELTQALPTQPEHWSANFEQLVTDMTTTLRLRRDMLAALATT